VARSRGDELAKVPYPTVRFRDIVLAMILFI